MTEPGISPTESEPHSDGTDGTLKAPQAQEEARQGRRFSVGTRRGQARARVRYIEGNHPAGGCRFLG